ncbi:type I polyketide synthase [Aspergillus tanneri]|uniref:Type I Polyketide synthases (Type I PKS) n=1 Tax=Aspergillus tanneri TaxID=1220188 RepID=A0A5M9NDF9_9EURO|nr:Type I Polyketide synthases (Type I PKS) [Aspergillus tanneri]KAA8652757.1 Type I Polyketide synthases (Type I PKS) [Aspergillus tanneri]
MGLSSKSGNVTPDGYGDKRVNGLTSDLYGGNETSMPITIIGLLCKFPGDATSPDKFWRLLEDGRNTFSSDTGFRFDIKAHYHPHRAQSGTFNPVGAHFIQQDLSLFDAPFFNISAPEARAMDPQQRQTLESTYEAIENAGITMQALAGSNTAVFVNTYNRDWFAIALRDPEAIPKYQALGTGDALMSNRVSYFFDLKGPSMTLDTGSSRSMVAVHQACQSLRTGESSQAIVSTVNLILDPELLIGMSNLGFLSDNGQCLTFDGRGNGYGRGEGVASLILKPLHMALRDGNPIQAIVRNTFANQDGRTPGITMPSMDAQIAMINSAYGSVGLDMKDTAYCECHGTGTPAGDPVEAKAVASTIAKSHTANKPLFVGSVKTNIGHLESCASLAGLIKTVLMLEKGVIVPNYDFQIPHPEIHFDEWHMKVVSERIPWPNASYRRASVNAFGYGGTNCHAILDAAESYFATASLSSGFLCLPSAGTQNDVTDKEEIDVKAGRNDLSIPRIFVLSARTDKALQSMIRDLSLYLREFSEPEGSMLDNLVYTLCLRRSHLQQRFAMVTPSLEELVQTLETSTSSAEDFNKSRSGDIGFYFTGQGAQWPKMGRELLRAFPIFRKSLLQTGRHLCSFGASWFLIDELLKDEEQSCLQEAEISQPICTAVQIALVDLFDSWGIKPVGVVGHSSSEIAAAYAAGILSAEAAARVSFLRGIWAARAKSRNKSAGAMLAAGISETEAAKYIAVVPVDLGLSLSEDVLYLPSLIRNKDSTQAALKLARRLFVQHFPVKLDEIFKGRNYSNPVTLSNLPAYPWDHSVTYWTESRLSSDYRLRNRPRHQLLGVPTTDWNPLEPSWRHILRTNKLPWLRGHMVEGQIIYPAAGYISAVLQACHETLISGGKDNIQKPLQVTFRDVHISNALVIPDDLEGVEIVIRLRPYYASTQDASSVWQEFFICSYSKSSMWNENCRGLVLVRHDDYNSLEDIDFCTLDAFQGQVIPDPYKILLDLGYKFSEPFVNIKRVTAKPHKALSVLCVPNTSQFMNHGYELPQALHPATLDCVFQTPLTALIAADCLGCPMVPVHCDKITLAGDLEHHPGEKLLVFAETTPEGQRKCKVRAIIKNTVGTPRMYIEGLTYRALGGVGDEGKRNPRRTMCHRIHWAADVDKMEGKELIALTTSDLSLELPLDQLAQIRAACYVLMEQALRALCEDKVSARASEHHKKLYKWIKSKLSHREKENPYINDRSLQTHVEALGAVGKIIYRIGGQLTKIILGEIKPLELITADGLLDKFYQENSIKRCYAALARYVNCLREKEPNLKILEVGAGTGGATKHLLEALGTKFHRYEFTDISTGFFSNAREKFKRWGSSVHYKKLDIEKDPTEQGFDEGTYDLVVASNVLHATRSMQGTMRNVHQLLKPFSRLLLLEITRPMEYIGMIFGTLPGWWFGRSDGRQNSPCMNISEWQVVLEQTGFSGVEVYIPDYDDRDCSQYSVILSRKVATRSSNLDKAAEIVISTDASAVITELSQSVTNALGNKNCYTTTLADCQPDGKICIVLEELTRPVLLSCTESEFQQIQRMLRTASGIIWLTRGSSNACEVPDRALITGLARAARSENNSLRFITLDTDLTRPLCRKTTKSIVEFCKDISQGIGHEDSEGRKDSEYLKKQGSLYIPRLVEDESTSKYITGIGQVSTQDLKVTRATRPLKLDITVPGRLDTLQWTECESPVSHPELDEILVDVKALGLNFRDLIIALGQFSDASEMTGECSGVVKAVGTNIRHVFKAVGVNRIDNTISFEKAASIPVAYTTAYYAVVELAHLQRGETILIHSGASAVGQVAIILAQDIGAEIFVTVGNNLKREFLQTQYKISNDHIFSNRSTAFVREIRRITVDRGVNVLVNSIAGEIGRESCSCLALFGRFVELGVYDILQNSRLDMRFMQRNVVPKPAAGIQFREDASYLIARGLGGLGHAIIEWMGRLEAKNIIALSRFPLQDSELKSWVSSIKRMGVNLAVYTCDITIQAELEKALQQAQVEMPPIRGVIQAAMVLKDSVINNMTYSDFSAAVRPKVVGSLNLHNAFLTQHLDFFILLSSAAGIVGNSGQANYAAGCTFQDALARYRVRLGLPAHSIDLGMIQSAGYVAENPEAVQFLREQGYAEVELDQFLRLLSKVIQSPLRIVEQAHTIVGLQYDQSSSKGIVPQHLLDPKFKHLLSSDHESNKPATTNSNLNVRTALRDAKTKQDAVKIITDALVLRLQQLLSMGSKDISQSQSITELGADSLVAVELRNWISREMDAEVQTLEVLQHIPITRFATILASRSTLVSGCS